MGKPIQTRIDTNRAESAEVSACEAEDRAETLSEGLATMQTDHNALREDLARVTAIPDERERLLERLERGLDSTATASNEDTERKASK